MRALVVMSIVIAGAHASAGADTREMCGPNARYRGATIDLDLKAADIHDVYRLLGDVGRVNIVLPDDVIGKVTLRLKRVPWDQAACTVAAVHNLMITIDRNVLLVMKRPATSPAPGERRAALPAGR